jgi:hypothetical protein
VACARHVGGCARLDRPTNVSAPRQGGRHRLSNRGQPTGVPYSRVYVRVCIIEMTMSLSLSLDQDVLLSDKVDWCLCVALPCLQATWSSTACPTVCLLVSPSIFQILLCSSKTPADPPFKSCWCCKLCSSFCLREKFRYGTSQHAPPSSPGPCCGLRGLLVTSLATLLAHRIPLSLYLIFHSVQQLLHSSACSLTQSMHVKRV